ncbi:hypothetical protein ACQ4PT_048462 [Festuca glaucescens]
MAPRTKLCKNKAPGTDEPAEKVRVSGWEHSKISAQDQKTLKKMGLLKKEALKMSGDESSPRPPIGFWVTFVDFLVRGLAVPVHEFLRGLLFIYGIQLHQLTPNSLLHISIFITLCECFLGIHPHWGLWKRIFYLRCNNSRNVIYNDHQILSSLPPLPEGGEVDGRVVVTDNSQESSLPESEAVESQRSAGSSKKETELGHHSESAYSISPPLATSPDGRKRKTDNVKDSGASKLAETAAEESSPEEQGAFDPFADAGAVSSSDEGAEEEEPAAHGPAPTSTSNTLVLSEEHRTVAQTSPPPQHNSEAPTPVPSPRAPLAKKARTGAGNTRELATGSTSAPLLEDPLMKELVNLGSQFIGFHDEAATLREALRRAEERADALEAKLKSSETARKKAEKDAVAVESLCQRLKTAEDALSDKEAQQIERENAIVERFETQNRRFTTGQMGEQYTLNQESDDRLLDALEILELNCDLARTNISSARAALKRVFPHFFPKDTQSEIFSQLTQHFLAKEDPALAYRQASLKIRVEGTIALVAASGQEVDWVKAGTPKGIKKEKWKTLVKDAKPHSKKLIAFLDSTSSASARTARTEVK